MFPDQDRRGLGLNTKANNVISRNVSDEKSFSHRYKISRYVCLLQVG